MRARVLGGTALVLGGGTLALEPVPLGDVAQVRLVLRLGHVRLPHDVRGAEEHALEVVRLDRPEPDLDVRRRVVGEPEPQELLAGRHGLGDDRQRRRRGRRGRRDDERAGLDGRAVTSAATAAGVDEREPLVRIGDAARVVGAIAERARLHLLAIGDHLGVQRELVRRVYEQLDLLAPLRADRRQLDLERALAADRLRAIPGLLGDLRLEPRLVRCVRCAWAW